MTRLVPEKLHVKYLPGAGPDSPVSPRYYTLTHSDSTGDLFLTIGQCYDRKQVSKWYTRLMRDEVLAELKKDPEGYSLNVYCHVSGGLVLGRAKWRYDIFCSELSLALEAIRYGDRILFDGDPKFDRIPVLVSFKSTDDRYNKIERWGLLEDYKLQTDCARYTSMAVNGNLTDKLRMRRYTVVDKPILFLFSWPADFDPKEQKKMVIFRHPK